MEIPLAESRHLTRWYYLLLAASLGAIAIVAIRASALWGLLYLAVFPYGVHILRRDLKRTTTNAITALRITPRARLLAKSADRWQPHQIESWWAGQSLILIALKNKTEPRWKPARPIIIHRNVTPDQKYRALKVWLKENA